LPDILCALGISQLKRIQINISKRLEIAARYDSLLSSEVIRPYRSNSLQHAFHLYVVRTRERKQLYDYLKTKGIFTQVHYIPIHSQPYYRELYGHISLPNAENYYKEALSIPMYHCLSEQDQEYVIKMINSFFGGR